MQKLLKQILTSKVYEAAIETPLDESKILSEQLNNRILLKREDLQPVFSFKIRGAYNRIANLSEEERAKGIITASAGNHYYVSAAGRTITLPSSPSLGHEVRVTVGNYTDTIVARNGVKIMASTTDMTLNIPYLSVLLTYTNAAIGWVSV